MSHAAAPLELPGFQYQRIEVDGTTISCAVGGSGAPVLLLHGYPENHVTWRDVAPALADNHTVVLADLRGYGSSDKPAPDRAGLVYSKRSMARDQVGLMRKLGFQDFQLVGHDRGARVGHRLVLDHPTVVTSLAVLDILPTRYALLNVDRTAAAANYHWFFLAAGGGVPEHMIAADPDFWVRALVSRLLGAGASLRPDVLDEYVRCFRDPGTIAGSCADFRSGLSVDLDHDDETFDAGEKIQCPLLVLWGKQGMAGGPGDNPVSIWQQYAISVRGSELPTGHFVPEEAPGKVITALRDFLA